MPRGFFSAVRRGLGDGLGAKIETGGAFRLNFVAFFGGDIGKEEQRRYRLKNTQIACVF